MVFDSNLYYENGIYRTPTMLGLLSHNHLKMKEKGLLIYEKKEGLLDEDPLSGERQGFEPWVRASGQRFSRPPRSATPASLHFFGANISI